jgi:glycogen debranching enzyme
MSVEEIILVADRHYILATSPRVDDQSHVLKHGDTFGVFDHVGDIRQVGLCEEGVYHEGTRYLSSLSLTINGQSPLLLSSTVRKDNTILTVDLTNPDLEVVNDVALPRAMLHVMRSTLIHEETCHLRIDVKSFCPSRLRVTLRIAFAADFKDVFEVRGTRRVKRGEYLEPVLGSDGVELRYRGLDGILRRTCIDFDEVPARLGAGEAELVASLPPRGEKGFRARIRCVVGEHAPARLNRFERAAEGVRAERRGLGAGDLHVETSNTLFNDWLVRSSSDIHLMLARTPHGFYPHAGIPWFSAPFGRDGIITAHQLLWVNPEVARGVLTFLTATQATTIDRERDAEPGKIVHEIRKGEMANLGEIPFGLYYGTVDATPLFIVLAADYYRRTADLELIRSIWPNIERALGWLDLHGDSDGDGFVEYSRQSHTGLVVQGWKDSYDSVFHADGSLAEGPIALCEVQGYAYAAKLAAAELADALGDGARARRLALAAAMLRERFEGAFWCEDLSTYALALDGHKAPCRVRTSNPGHCLWSGIVRADRAARVASTLLHASSFTGWGVRTVASSEVRFNPMSYHNGSIWPHDNALFAAGLARYGLRREALRVFSALFDASHHLDLHRLPELFCGFPRRRDQGPTLYPVACAPQAWAAAAVFLLLASCLGLGIDAPARRIVLSRPSLPQWLERVTISRLQVCGASVDFEVYRHGEDSGVRLLRRSGDVEVHLIK